MGTHTMFHAQLDPISDEWETFRSYLEKGSQKVILKNVPFYNLLSFIRQEMLPDCKNTRIKNLTRKPCLYIEVISCTIHIGLKTVVGY
jgi:hypothetical protein